MLDGGIIGEIVVEEKSGSRGFGDRENWGEDGECGGGVGHCTLSSTTVLKGNVTQRRGLLHDVLVKKESESNT